MNVLYTRTIPANNFPGLFQQIALNNFFKHTVVSTIIPSINTQPPCYNNLETTTVNKQPQPEQLHTSAGTERRLCSADGPNNNIILILVKYSLFHKLSVSQQNSSEFLFCQAQPQLQLQLQLRLAFILISHPPT